MLLADSIESSVRLLIQLRATCPGDDAVHSGLGPPALIDNQDNPTDTSMAQSVLGNPSIETNFSGNSRLCQVDN